MAIKLKALTIANHDIDELGMFWDDDPEMSNNQVFQNNTVSLSLADRLRGSCLLKPVLKQIWSQYVALCCNMLQYVAMLAHMFEKPHIQLNKKISVLMEDSETVTKKI